MHAQPHSPRPHQPPHQHSPDLVVVSQEGQGVHLVLPTDALAVNAVEVEAVVVRRLAPLPQPLVQLGLRHGAVRRSSPKTGGLSIRRMHSTALRRHTAQQYISGSLNPPPAHTAQHRTSSCTATPSLS